MCCVDRHGEGGYKNADVVRAALCQIWELLYLPMGPGNPDRTQRLPSPCLENKRQYWDNGSLDCPARRQVNARRRLLHVQATVHHCRHDGPCPARAPATCFGSGTWPPALFIPGTQEMHISDVCDILVGVLHYLEILPDDLRKQKALCHTGARAPCARTLQQDNSAAEAR